MCPGVALGPRPAPGTGQAAGKAHYKSRLAAIEGGQGGWLRVALGVIDQKNGLFLIDYSLLTRAPQKIIKQQPITSLFLYLSSIFGQTAPVNLNQSMRTMDKFTLSMRRDSYMRTVRQREREQIKGVMREEIMRAYGAEEDIWRIHEVMDGCNLTSEGLREAVRRVRRGMEVRQFRVQLNNSKIVDDLLWSVTEGKEELREQVERVVELAHDLVTLDPIFRGLLSRLLPNLVLAVQQNISSTVIMDRVASILGLKQLGYIEEEECVLHYRNNRKVQGIQLVRRLVQLYLLSPGYQSKGVGWKGQVIKGSKEWHIFAVKALEVSWGVMFLAEQSTIRSQLDKEVIILRALEEGMRMASSANTMIECSKRRDLSEKEMGSQQETIQSEHWQDHAQKWLYFISLILDIALLRSSVMSQHEAQTVLALLNQLLSRIHIEAKTAHVAVKCIKLLYQQMLVGDQELQVLVEKHPCLRQPVERVIDELNCV